MHKAVIFAGLLAVACSKTVSALTWEIREGTECEPGVGYRNGVQAEVRGCGRDEKTRLICDRESKTWKKEENETYPRCEKENEYCKEGDLFYDKGIPSGRWQRDPGRYRDTSCAEGQRVRGWDNNEHGWNCTWWIAENPTWLIAANDAEREADLSTQICDDSRTHLWTCKNRGTEKADEYNRTWGDLKRCSKGCHNLIQPEAKGAAPYVLCN